MTATYRMTFTDSELIALSQFLSSTSPELISYNKHLSSAASKIKVQAFKCSVGAATPAYIQNSSVRMNDLHPNDLGFNLNDIEFAQQNSSSVQPTSTVPQLVKVEPSEDDFVAAEAQLLEEFQRMNKGKPPSNI